ncbi:MAG TPA: hypothetical protein VJ549_03520 [Geothrix sp.]|nr:hypothetical protein [Geothrix sp.]
MTRHRLWTRHRLFSALAPCILAGGALTLGAQHERRNEEPRPERLQERHPNREAPRERGPEPHRQAPRAVPSRPELERPSEFRPPRQIRPEPFEPKGPPRTEARPIVRDPGRSSGSVRPARTVEAARAWQARQSWRQGAWPAHASWQEHRAHRWENEHRTWTQRGGYGGYRIPEAQFARTFGDRHAFRIGSRPLIYGGYPRFRCGGYWFLIVDPWPEFWVDDWYLWDDVYIDYDFDGYYLLDRHHPGVRLALMVSL